MALNVNTITPALVKAKNVATEEYVDGNIVSTSEDFATNLGYGSFSDMKTAAIAGYTVVTGGSINTELIQADNILVNNLNATNAIIAKRLNADTVIANDITGSTITGSYLEGVVIRNSWIDPTSVGMLTLWAEATDIEDSSSIYYPYRNNFAFNADGSYTIDANGYYRLGGLSTPITIDGNGAHDISKTYPWFGGTITRGLNSAFSYTNINKGLFIPSYDSYKVSTPNRPISQSPLVNLHNMTGSSSKTIMVSSLLGGSIASLYIGTYTKATFYINNVIYKIEQVATAPYGMSSRFRIYNANDTVLYSIDVNYTNDQTTHIYKIATLGDFDIIAEFDGHFDNTGGTEPQEYWVSYAYLKIVGNSGGTTTTTSVGPLHNNGDAVKFIVLKDAEGAGTTSGADTFARITTYDLDIVLQP